MDRLEFQRANSGGTVERALGGDYQIGRPIRKLVP